MAPGTWQMVDVEMCFRVGISDLVSQIITDYLRKAETFQKMKSYSCLLHLLFPSDKCIYNCTFILIYTHTHFETIRCVLRYETPERPWELAAWALGVDFLQKSQIQDE